ncbi:MAG: hypothetical protein P9X24_01180 [Candidatus Hatepunaea meridiana]|nr:hypothetical protein [Candidatus Hatepunaea meridiana]
MKRHVRRCHSETGLSPKINNRMETNKRDISAPRRKLLEVMQDINFGRIEGLQVREGEPVFDPMPTMLSLFLFGKDNGPNASRRNDGLIIKKKVVELFEVFDREQSLSIRELMIDDGLPVRMTATYVLRV